MELEKQPVSHDPENTTGEKNNGSLASIDQKGSEESVTNKKYVRDTWGGKFEFLLSVIGYTVGISNIWRFPYICYKNGGGAFLIPFTIFLILCAGPLYYLEVCIAQFSGKSSFNVWEICPLVKGIGIAMNLITIIITWYFNVIFAWIFYYLSQSFYPTLSWTTCSNSWNTHLCLDVTSNDVMKNYFNFVNKTDPVATEAHLTENITIEYQTPGMEFWNYKVLNLSRDISETGTIQWHSLIGLFVGCLLIFLCTMGGVKTIGKIVYVTVTAPYILLTILMIRGMTLDGAVDGLKLYLIPKLDKLASLQIWIDAAVQVFYSLGAGWGCVITMSSFNKFHHNAFRDSVIACCVDVFTAFYGGLVVFSVLGFLSKQTGTPVDKLPFSGPSLAFIVYPEALGQLPLPQLWSVLFFLTLVFLGIDSQFASFETVVNLIIDTNYAKLHRYRKPISASLAIGLFVTGIPLAYSNGFHIFMLTDWYLVSFTVLFIAIVECVVIGWVYGANRLSNDIRMMRGSRPSVFLRLAWSFFNPMFLAIILCFNAMNYSSPRLSGGDKFPLLSVVIGNFIAFGPIIVVFAIALIQICKQSGTLPRRVSTLLKPTSSWHPSDFIAEEIYQANPYVYANGPWQRIKIDVLGLSD